MNELIQATQTIIDQETVLKLIAAQEVFLGPWKTNLWRQAIDGIIDYTTGQRVIGWCDGHVHLDRVFTFEADFFPTGTPVSETADLPLPLKQDFIGGLHNGPAYSEESLKSRMEHQIKRAVTFGTRELWAITDTTPDIKLRAFNIALSLKEQYKDKIHIFVGSYPVFGFKNPEVNPDRLDCLISTMGKADFIVGLPEKDEEPTRIGFKGHVNLLLELGFKHQKEVHIHADQANTAHSNDSLRVIECLEGLVPEKLNWYIAPKQSPKLWLVHVISPSSYAPEKFTRLVRLLVKYNIGVIVCPRAALSMRDLRSEKTPTHNSIARVLEMLRFGVRIRFGTDNVNDIFVPSGDGSILTEIDILADIIRHYTQHIFAKVAMGITLNNADKHLISRALHEKKKAVARHAQNIAISEINEEIIIDF